MADHEEVVQAGDGGGHFRDVRVIDDVQDQFGWEPVNWLSELVVELLLPQFAAFDCAGFVPVRLEG